MRDSPSFSMVNRAKGAAQAAPFAESSVRFQSAVMYLSMMV